MMRHYSLRWLVLFPRANNSFEPEPAGSFRLIASIVLLMLLPEGDNALNLVVDDTFVESVSELLSLYESSLT